MEFGVGGVGWTKYIPTAFIGKLQPGAKNQTQLICIIKFDHLCKTKSFDSWLVENLDKIGSCSNTTILDIPTNLKKNGWGEEEKGGEKKERIKLWNGPVKVQTST